MSRSSALWVLLTLAACHGGDDDGFGKPPVGDDSAAPVAPVITVLTPAEGQSFGADQLIHLSARVEDDDPPSDLAVVIWVNNAVYSSAVLSWSGDTFSTDLSLGVGTQNIEVHATDPAGNGGSASVSVEVIADQPPTAPVVVIEPASPVSGDALFAGFVEWSVDPEGLPVEYDYAWSRDGAAMSAYDGLSSVPSGVVHYGETWSVSVSASDGVLSSDPGSASVLIGPVGPVLTVGITPTTPRVTDSLVCTYSIDEPDGQPITAGGAVWQVNGAAVGDASLPLTGAFVRGDTVDCVVSATSTSTVSASASVSIFNSLPMVTTVELTGAPANESGELGCSAEGSDADGDPINITLYWLVNGNVVTTGSALTGARFDRGDEVWCTAIADDGVDNGPSMDSVHVVIENSAPSAGSVEIGPSLAVPGTLLSCTQTLAASDPDPADTLSTLVRWLVNGVEVSSGSDWSFDSTGLGVADTVACEVEVSDGDASASASASLTLGGRLSGALALGDADLTLSGSSARGFFGGTIEAPGDLDGDGLPELAIAGTGYGSDAGALHLWSGADLGPGAQADSDATWIFDGPAAGAMLGDAHGLSGSADIDGDGRPELLVGADRASIGSTEDGAVYLLLSGDSGGWSSGGINAAAALEIYGAVSRDRFGSAMAGADIDGDGVADLLVGAGLNDDAATSAGAVYVFLDPASLSGSLRADDADVTWTGAAQSDRLGLNAVTSLGDIDGDGSPDFGLGAPTADGSLANDSGAVYIVSGNSLSSGPVSSAATVRIDGFDTDDDFGISVAALGDLDLDGLDDFAVGGRFADVWVSDAGGVYVWFGGAMSGVTTVMSSDACWGSNANGDRLGYEMSAADIDGDGLFELSVGTYSRADGGNANAGAAWMLLGSGGTSWPVGGPVDNLAQTYVVGAAAGNYLGRDPTVIDDLNGDGYGEWVVGAQSETQGSTTRAGGVYVFYGP